MPIAIDFKLQDLICVAPAIFLFLGSLLPLTVKVMRGNEEPNSGVAATLSLFGVFAALAAAGLLYAQQTAPYFAFSNALVFDGVSVLATVMVCVILGIAILISRENRATSGPHFSEYLFLLMNSAVGMMILAWSNDLIMTFIAIEIMSLCLYLIIALSREEKLAKEAAFKYFVLGSFASAIFLYGIAFIYGITGTTYMPELTKVIPTAISSNYILLFGVVMTILGFCFKAAIVPFHAWTPDVYEGAPTPVTGFMATGVKLVTFVAFLRFMRSDFIGLEVSGQLSTVLQWLAVLTMCVGNIAAILQSSFKRMLAYSSIAHGGYVMMGLIAAASGGEGWRGDLGVIYYTVAYTIMTLGAFAVVCLLERREEDQILIEDLRGLGSRHKLIALTLVIFMLSLAGIPPLIGFFGKFFVFFAAIKQGLFWLAVWGAINSVISAYYYLRPIVLMYMKDEPGLEVVSQHRWTRAVVVVLAFLTVALGVATEPVYQQVLQAINSLL